MTDKQDTPTPEVDDSAEAQAAEVEATSEPTEASADAAPQDEVGATEEAPAAARKAHPDTYHPGDWNPYFAGFMLGLILLATYVLMGWGLGGSAAATRVAVAGAHVVAPEAVESNGYLGQYFAGGLSPFDNWMILEALGVILGGIIGAYSAGRIRFGHVEKGPRSSVAMRLVLALIGGIVMGFAARLGRGCTSGQALTGGSVFAVGSWIYMIFVFVGGYLAAPFVRREWR